MPERLRTPRLSISHRTVINLLIMVGLLLGGCNNAAAKIYHVGVLSGLSAFSPAIDGFKAKMTELGYVEGKNITYDIQSTEVDMEAYQSITEKFVEDKVDLIFVFPTEATAVAKEAVQGTNIPVLFVLAFTDVPDIHLIDSVREPGGNITGIRFPSIDIASQRMHFLLDIAPEAKRILVPYLKDYPNVPGQLDVIRAQAESAGVELVELAAASPQELQAELDKHAASGDPDIDAILMIAEPLAITPPFYSILGKFSYEHKIPIGGAMMNTDGYDSLFGLLPDAAQTGGEAALLADKVLKGTVAGQIPVVTAESYLQISMKAAQALDVTIPDGLLKRADVILH